MGKKEENLMNVVTSGLIVASTATGYALGVNEGLRRTGLGYTGRALWSLGGGVGIGLIVGMWAPRIGIGVFTGGFVSGAVNGMAAMKMAAYRGARDGSSAGRGDLPGAQTTPTGTGTPASPPAQPANPPPVNGMQRPSRGLPDHDHSRERIPAAAANDTRARAGSPIPNRAAAAAATRWDNRQ